MKKSEIIDQVNNMLDESGFPRVEPEEQHKPMQEFLAMDSLDFAEIIIKCEKQFNITITDESIGELKTFNDLIDHILDLKSIAV